MIENGEVLGELRKLRKRLEKLNEQQARLWAERRALYVQARASKVPLKNVAGAAGVSESAVTLALRDHRDVPRTPRGAASV